MNQSESNKPGNGDLFDDEARENRKMSVGEAGVDVNTENATSPVEPDAPSMTLGSMLRTARESRGLDLETCAHALRLQARLLRKLEADDYEGIDYQVYLRGYLCKYGAYLGLPADVLAMHIDALAPRQPGLVVTGGIPHSRYLLERYAAAATYVVLTAVIIVPVIWLGLRGGLNHDMARLAPLDATPVAQSVQNPPTATRAGSSASTGNRRKNTAVQGSAPSSSDEQPLLASMAPFSALDTVEAPPPSSAPVSIDGPGHSVTLKLIAASWVEIVAKDGTRLEYGLLPAGTDKTYRSLQPIDVRIGNARGAQVDIDDQPLDLGAYRHANVAHFKVDNATGKTSPGKA